MQRCYNQIKAEIKYHDSRYGTEWEKLAHSTAGSAGLDLRAATHTPITLAPGQEIMIDTGFSIWLKDPNYCGFIHPRSGMGTKGLVIGNLTGVIDADYQGPIKLKLWNRSSTETFTINPGDRVAQYVVGPVLHLDLTEVSDFSNQTVRGKNGIGSTGNK